MKDGIYRATLRGDSTYVNDRIAAVAADLKKKEIRVDPGRTNLLRTRSEVEQGWRVVGEIICKQEKSDIVKRNREQKGPPDSFIRTPTQRAVPGKRWGPVHNVITVPLGLSSENWHVHA
jgi:hypothetical protein